MIGKVKWFDVKKGYGFILNSDGQDVFVHFSVIQSDGFRVLKDGEEVEYEQTAGPKGLLANSVKRINRPAKAPTGAPPTPATQAQTGSVE